MSRARRELRRRAAAEFVWLVALVAFGACAGAVLARALGAQPRAVTSEPTLAPVLVTAPLFRMELVSATSRRHYAVRVDRDRRVRRDSAWWHYRVAVALVPDTLVWDDAALTDTADLALPATANGLGWLRTMTAGATVLARAMIARWETLATCGRAEWDVQRRRLPCA